MRYGVALCLRLSPVAARALREAIVQTAAPTSTRRSSTTRKAAASLMAMNNVFYRFRHIVGKPSYSALPARLRMNRIAQPKTSKAEFELASSRSAINGCDVPCGATSRPCSPKASSEAVRPRRRAHCRRDRRRFDGTRALEIHARCRRGTPRLTLSAGIAGAPGPRVASGRPFVRVVYLAGRGSSFWNSARSAQQGREVHVLRGVVAVARVRGDRLRRARRAPPSRARQRLRAGEVVGQRRALLAVDLGEQRVALLERRDRLRDALCDRAARGSTRRRPSPSRSVPWARASRASRRARAPAGSSRSADRAAPSSRAGTRPRRSAPSSRPRAWADTSPSSPAGRVRERRERHLVAELVGVVLGPAAAQVQHAQRQHDALELGARERRLAPRARCARRAGRSNSRAAQVKAW